MRFGKLPPKKDYRTLMFQNYLTDQIPDPPKQLFNTERAFKKLASDGFKPDPTIETFFPMDGNDEYGCCVVAGAAHGLTLYHGLVGTRHIPTKEEVIRIYFHLSGGADSGLYLLDALNYWRRSGFIDSKIYAFSSVMHHNHTHIKQAIQLFGGLMMGFQVQEKAIEDFQAGRTWTPGRLTYGGHCVFVTGYDEQGLYLLTWGKQHKGSWEWWDSCVDESYALLPPEAATEDFSPGFNFEQLRKDLSEVAVI